MDAVVDAIIAIGSADSEQNSEMGDGDNNYCSETDDEFLYQSYDM